MALSSYVVRRGAASLISLAARSAASSSLAYRSPGSSSFSVLPLFTSRRLSFSTYTCPPDSSDFAKLPACGASDKLSPVPQLNGLLFDSMEVDRDECTMTLRRKTKDEIIEILVRPHSEDDGYEEDIIYVWDDTNAPDDYDWNDDNFDNGNADNEEMMDSESNEEDKKSNEVDCNEDEDGETTDEFVVGWIPRLHLRVKILYGDNFDRCLEFIGLAYPNDHDKLKIHTLSFRKANKSGEPVGPGHLNEFEGFFKKRGIQASNYNFLFDYINKRKSIGVGP